MTTLLARDGASVVVEEDHMEGAVAPSGPICDRESTLQAIHAHLKEGAFDTQVLSTTRTQEMFDLLNAATAIGLKSLSEPISQFISNHIKTLNKNEAAVFLCTDAAAAAEPAADEVQQETTWLSALQDQGSA